MKHLKIIALILVLAIANSANAADAEKESPKSDGKGAIIERAAFVDLTKVIGQSKAAKSIEKQIEALKNKYQADAKSKESSLKSREKELAEQKKALSKEAFEKKVQEFRARVQADQKQVGKYQHILQAAYVKAIDALKVQAVLAAGEYAKQSNITIVYPKSQLLYGVNALDITDQVLETLNDKVPEINISIDKSIEQAGAPKKADKKK